MSLPLATKGVLHQGITHSTKGVIYYAGAIGEIITAIVPQLIARREAITSVVRRAVISKIVRREDG